MSESTLCVGVDVHLDDLKLYPLDKASGEAVEEPFTVPNNRHGAEEAVATLSRILAQHDYDLLELAEEATNFYWLPFYEFVRDSPLLAPYHPRVVLFNPKLIAEFKKGLDLRHEKSDRRDALAIAERLRFGRLPDSYVPDHFWQGLRRLTRYRYCLVRDKTREKNRFRAYLFLKLSAWQQIEPFDDPSGATSGNLLTQYSVHELARLPFHELVSLIKRYGRSMFADPSSNARKVRKAMEASYTISPDLDEMLTFNLTVMLDHIRYIDKLVKRIDSEIARWIEPVPNPLITIPGLGPVTTAGILSEVVDISRFPDQSDLAAYTGLIWSHSSTGRFEAEDTYLTKTGCPVLRYYFTQGANAMRMHNLDYKAYYWRKYNESRKHKHKRALVLTARKLVRLVHALLTKNVSYVMPQAALKLQQEEMSADVLA